MAVPYQPQITSALLEISGWKAVLARNTCIWLENPKNGGTAVRKMPFEKPKQIYSRDFVYHQICPCFHPKKIRTRIPWIEIQL